MINLLTCSEANNYGTVLQTYATQKIFEELGEKVIVIDYRKNYNDTKPYSLKNAKTLKSKLSFLIFYFHRKNKSNAFAFFKNNYIRYSDTVYNTNNIKQLISYMNQCSCICIGSDQVWNPKIQNIELFTLGNVDNRVKKISFSSSMGNAYTIKETSDILKRNLVRFNSLSVREKCAKQYIEKLLDKEVQRVIDPTLVLDYTFWKKIEKEYNVPQKYIFLYLASNSITLLRYAYKRAKKNKCILLILSDIYYPIPSSVVKNLKGVSPENFLFLMDHAIEVYTNSYHGLVFSINFRKNFGVEMPIENDDRIETVLDIMGLQDREIRYKNIENINYQRINNILEYERIKAIDFIKKTIQGLKDEKE